MVVLLAKRWNQTGNVIIHPQTTDEPISLIGEFSGICYNSDTENEEKNYKRGLDCIESNHGRTLEFPQIYMIIKGYSAKCIREFGRHIGGAPTYLQASTRYIDYKDFDFIVPDKIVNIPEAEKVYQDTISQIKDSMVKLSKMGIPKEDSSMLCPLSMGTTIVYRTNLRGLIDMSRVRKCSRAFWEYRQLFKEIEDALAIYSDQWNTLINELHVFHPKCEEYGYCNEKFSCGRMPKKEKKNA